MNEKSVRTAIPRRASAAAADSRTAQVVPLPTRRRPSSYPHSAPTSSRNVKGSMASRKASASMSGARES